MVQQDAILGKEVMYQAKYAIIQGHIRGLGQLSNGIRVAILETPAKAVFMGDITHMYLVEELRSL
jgi:hypothetical protein